MLRHPLIEACLGASRLRVATPILCAALAACGGGGTPMGPVVGSPGSGSGDPPPRLVAVRVSVTIPGASHSVKSDYLSTNTQSLAIQLVSVDGNGVSGVNPTIINTTAKSAHCKPQGKSLLCTDTATGSPGRDVFAVSTYSQTNAEGAVLSVGTVRATIASGGGSFGITNSLSLTLYGVIASLKLELAPNFAKRGDKLIAAVNLSAYDASGAQIVGPSDFEDPISLTIEGDSGGAFKLHAGDRSGTSLTIRKPPTALKLSYDGNKQASAITVNATVPASGISTGAGFALHGKQPPPPVGTIYVLNLGTKYGKGATVTEYDGKAKGNAAPQRTLDLDPKLYARSIAVDSSGNLYVGYLDNEFGFEVSNGTPDQHNEIAIYAPGASGKTQPKSVLTADDKSKTKLFPVFITFDPSGRNVTFGATDVDDNNGGDAVLTYAAGSSGSTAPEHGWQFASPQVRYAGPTGLTMDGDGNFYVNGGFYTVFGTNYGMFVNAAANIGDSQSAPAREIPWDSTTGLTPGQTTEIALDSGGEILVGNTVTQGSGSSTACQARVSVFAAGASGGTTDNPPLRVLTLDGVQTDNNTCASSRNPLVPFYPAIASYGSEIFVAGDFNNAVSAFSSNAKGNVKPSLTISGSATGLNAPSAIVVTK